MSLTSKCSSLRKSSVGAGSLLDLIYTDSLLPNSEADYVKKYFDEKPRKKIWEGSTIDGVFVKLSTAAETLKAAFQNRYFSTRQFQPFTAYHATKDQVTADLIVANGFRPASETLYGSGTYFFNARGNAEAYAKTGVNGRVLEVTIFSNIAVLDPNALGHDTLTLQTTAVKNIFLVKNALIIFPKRVYTP